MLELDSWYKNTSIREMHTCDYNCYFNMIGKSRENCVLDIRKTS